MFSKDIIDTDAPYIEGYDGRGKYVGREEHQMSHYGGPTHEVERDTIHPTLELLLPP